MQMLAVGCSWIADNIEDIRDRIGYDPRARLPGYFPESCRSVFRTTTASRRACGLTTFVRPHPSMQHCRAVHQPAVV
ncbi:hypothetical protein SAMN05216308_106196 [Nitrosospira sp. Nsp13]|nr:hypothetical protein SAMN05216308_106196 [Nitrosospira sp. Nsp13]